MLVKSKEDPNIHGRKKVVLGGHTEVSWKPDSIHVADYTHEVLCLLVVHVYVSFFSLPAFVLFGE